MLRLAKALPALLLLTCALCVSEARADTFVITSGSVHTGSALGGSFNFNGAGMSLNGVFNWGLFDQTIFPASQGGNILIRNTGSDVLSASGVINGISYPSFFYHSALVDINAVLPPINIPPGFGEEGNFSIVVPFDLTGTLSGCLQSQVIVGVCPAADVVFPTTLLVGEGTMTVHIFAFLLNGTYRLNVTGTDLTFGAPVPEPATLVLLTTGLLGTAAAARRRRRNVGR